MTAETTNETTKALQPVEFIDAWLNDNATWVDSRVVDFALDVRMLLSVDDRLPANERESVGADA
jgi:hypothetical protein